MKENLARADDTFVLPANDGFHGRGVRAVDGGIKPLLVGDLEFWYQRVSVELDLPAQQQRFLIREARQALCMLDPADQSSSIQHIPDFAVFQVDADGEPVALRPSGIDVFVGYEAKEDLGGAILRDNVHLKAEADRVVWHDEVTETFQMEVLKDV